MNRKRLQLSSEGFGSRLRICTDKITNQTGANGMTGERCNSIRPRQKTLQSRLQQGRM